MRVKGSILGSLFSASLAGMAGMSCCKTSLLLAVLGLGSSALALWLARYRTPLLVATAGLLGFAFYLVYRPRKGKSGDASPGCAISSRSMRADKVLLWVSTLAIAGLFAYSYYSPYLLRASTLPSSLRSPPVQVVVVKVEGMHCLGCRAVCEKALSQVAGVSKVRYEEQKGWFVIEAEQGKLQTSQLISAVERVQSPMGGPNYRVSEVRWQSSGESQ